MHGWIGGVVDLPLGIVVALFRLRLLNHVRDGGLWSYTRAAR